MSNRNDAVDGAGLVLTGDDVVCDAGFMQQVEVEFGGIFLISLQYYACPDLTVFQA